MALSQDQINAILEGTGTYTESSGLAEAELRFYQEVSQLAMEAGSVAVSQALGKTVKVSNPEVSEVAPQSLSQELSAQQIMIQTGYLTQQHFESLLLIKDYDVAVIFDILMGKDGRNPDLEMGDLQISAIGEVMNQLIGAAATALSRELEQTIAMIPPESKAINLEQDSLPESYRGPLLQIQYQLSIEGVLDSEIYEIRSLQNARSFYQTVMGQSDTQPASAPLDAPVTHSAQQSANQSANDYYLPATRSAPTGPPPTVRPVEFAPLQMGQIPQGNGGLERVMDIPLKVTVELGSTHLKVKKVLDLTKGSVIELDKLSGEPIDLLVNGRLMAKGEVVVLNENFGVRITEILGPAERLQHLSD